MTEADERPSALPKSKPYGTLVLNTKNAKDTKIPALSCSVNSVSALRGLCDEFRFRILIFNVGLRKAGKAAGRSKQNRCEFLNAKNAKDTKISALSCSVNSVSALRGLCDEFRFRILLLRRPRQFLGPPILRAEVVTQFACEPQFLGFILGVKSLFDSSACCGEIDGR